MSLDLLTHGLASPQVASTIMHISMGAFFAASGFNKLVSKERHATFVSTLVADRVPFVSFNQWWVPGWELFGGLGLALNIAPALFAGVLLVIMIVALCCEGVGRVTSYHPINKVDTLADWLYLQETLYAIILGSIVLGV